MRSNWRPSRGWRPSARFTPRAHPRTSFQTRVLGSRSLSAFFFDGLFASASDVVVLRFLSIYAIALGATNAEVGLLAIANGLGGIAALSPGAWLAERTRSRKLVVLLSGGGPGRLTVLLMALVPLVVGGRPAVYALIALSGARWFAGSLGHPSWMALLNDIIPEDLRGFYVSRRLLGMAVVAAVGAPLVGLFLRSAGGVDHVPAHQWAFVAAFALGAISTWWYSRIEEPPAHAGASRSAGSTRAMLRDRGFVRYLSGTLLLHSTTMIAGPFFAAYLVRDLGANAAEVGILGSVDAVSAVAGQALAGLIVVRYGSHRLLHGSMLLLPLLPLMWALASEPWHAGVPNLLGGAAWAAFNLAAFNVLLEYAPRDNLPRYAATHQTMVLASSFIGPAIGTAIVAAWGLRAAMVVSSAGRIVALGVMAWPGATAGTAGTTGTAAPASVPLPLQAIDGPADGAEDAGAGDDRDPGAARV